MRPILVDLCCCQGGASAGFERAGFDVVGLDLDPQPRYPYHFLQADVVAALGTLLSGGIWAFRTGLDDEVFRFLTLDDIAAFHASVPCQLYSGTHQINDNDHPDLIPPVRGLLDETGKPYVMENVVGAPLLEPVTLCGAMFGLRTYRHRLFETNWFLPEPEHPEHVARQAKMGRPPADGEFMHIVGNFSNVALAREIMGMPWANRDGLREAIPVAYAEYVGKHLMGVVRERALPARAEGVRA